MEKIIIVSRSAAQTRGVGKVLGRSLEAGSVVALSGELGTGKTEFIKGLARGIGVKQGHVSSPSFVLINEYPGRIPLYHVDLYRLSEGRDLEEIGLQEYFYGNGVTAIEWAEKAAPLIPSRHFWIHIQWTGLTRRQLTVKAHGTRYGELLETIRRKLKETRS
jgi:tRNA threonylcarbamoyladenosine biosynthesis protein TsaE